MGQFCESETCKASNSESRLGVHWSVLSISNQMISFDGWSFRKRRGFCWLHGLSKTNLLKPFSYRFVQPLLDLIWEKAVSAADRDRRQENSERFFLRANLNLKEKSGRLIFAELNSFISKSCCDQTHWFGRPIVQQMYMWPCRETFKQGNTEKWYVQNPWAPHKRI